ncbi:Deleted in malignant brain tumors 1 protein, partial [Antrostomus carolinensis]
LRLVNGSNSCLGRVEVLHDHKWGTVCDDAWDLQDATVVCRELGCGIALSAPGSAHFGPGVDPIWLDDVHCTGMESNLTKCGLNNWGEHNCGHSEDAGVVCSVRSSCRHMGLDEPSHPLVLFLAGPNPLQVRVQDGPGPCAGRVEVLYNTTWHGVCSSGWSLLEAEVVCRQLGCGPAQSAPFRAHLNQGDGHDLLEGLSCRGNEMLLLECQQRETGLGPCQQGLTAGVVCAETRDPSPAPLPFSEHTPAPPCPSWSEGPKAEPSTRGAAAESPGKLLRLAGGPGPCAGRVEVFHNGTWGTVCDDGWGSPEGQVVCRQLGCGTLLSVAPGARYGEGTGQIWLDEVNCTGNEDNIFDCRASAWGDNNCFHGEDAGVICSGNRITESQNGRASGVSGATELRLTNGLTHCEGRVEVTHNGTWAALCDEGWGLAEARVVCRQLGCGRALSAPDGLHFGQGPKEMWPNSVSCVGTETALSACKVKPRDNSTCHHGRRAGVVC